MIRAEIQANNAKAQDLANEQGGKVAQNVAAGVVGLVIWPIWFGMDFKDAAGKDAAALQARQQSQKIVNPRLKRREEHTQIAERFHVLGQVRNINSGVGH